MKSRIFFDLHTHTTYSHGKGSIADNAARAAELGLERLGISDHGPGSVSYGIDMKKIPQMRKDIEEAEKLFPQLKIELGVEANIANLSGRLDISREEQKLFDYIIAGYHYSYLGEKPFTGISICVGGWLHERGLTTSARTRVRNTDIVVNSLLENKIDIISHPGDKADFDIDAIAAFVASISSDTPLHVTRFFPRWRMLDASPTPVATVRRLADIARRRLSRVLVGNC